jgi:hypothetical protein
MLHNTVQFLCFACVGRGCERVCDLSLGPPAHSVNVVYTCHVLVPRQETATITAKAGIRRDLLSTSRSIENAEHQPASAGCLSTAFSLVARVILCCVAGGLPVPPNSLAPLYLVSVTTRTKQFQVVATSLSHCLGCCSKCVGCGAYGRDKWQF